MSSSIFVSFKTHIISFTLLRTPSHPPLVQSSKLRGQLRGSARTTEATELPQSLGRTGSGDTESPEKETETKMMLPESSFCVTTNLTKMMSDELLTDLETVNL